MKADLDYKEIYNIKNIIKYASTFIIIISLIYSILFYTILLFYKETYNELETKLSNTKMDILEICNIIKCKEILIKHDEDDFKLFKVNREGVISEVKTYTIKDLKKQPKPDWLDYTFIKSFTNNLDVVLNLPTGKILIDNRIYTKAVYRSFILIGIVFFLPCLITYIFITTRINIRNKIHKGLYKSELETKLQRDITEVIHHELGVPITIIETNVHALYYRLFPCKKNNNIGCSSINNRKCEYCIGTSSMDKDELDKYKLFENLNLGIERVKSILKLISNSKHIKHSNGTVSIYDICENISSSVNSFNICKLTSYYKNVDILKKYSVVRDLGNGNMLNILNILLNNSVEAMSTEILFEPVVVSDSLLYLYVSDNGKGILDNNNNPIKDPNIIFYYGYSSKDDNCPDFKENKIINFLGSILGFNVKYGSRPSRGIGLFIARETLRQAGGDLELAKTSNEGTTFKLTLPIKKTKIVNNDEKK